MQQPGPNFFAPILNDGKPASEIDGDVASLTAFLVDSDVNPTGASEPVQLAQKFICRSLVQYNGVRGGWHRGFGWLILAPCSHRCSSPNARRAI